MTFREFMALYQSSPRAQHGVFSLSAKVKCMDDYLDHRDQPIDFCPDQFRTWYRSNLPIERITKEVNFCGLSLRLMDEVFCPRHETEIIVEELNKKRDLRGNYIDICSGTGAIGIAVLKSHPNLKGTLLDMCPKAVQNIKENLGRHGVQAQVIQSDWLEYLKRFPNQQIITANFPYVSPEDPLDPNITDPPLSLFASDGGWEHYEKLLNHLRSNPHWSLVILECSAHHRHRWQAAKDLNITLIEDLNRHLRVAVIKRKD